MGGLRKGGTSFDGWVQEAKRLVEAGLPIPAYGQLLKLSHAFNILDARGAVGVTERATCFAAMRSLARQIAGELLLWLHAAGEVLLLVKC